MTRDRVALFDSWEQTYDAGLVGDQEFPFIGYGAVLRGAADLALAHEPDRLLDVGVGTGNLTTTLLDARPGLDVVGLDFSASMLEQLSIKHPLVTGLHHDLNTGAPSLPARCDAAVAAFVLHEFPPDHQRQLVCELFDRVLHAEGILVIADIGFADSASREQGHLRFGDRWDPDEHYFAAAEFCQDLADAGLAARHQVASDCAVIMEVRPSSPPAR